MINISICVSDIPKESITTSEKNGKKYLNLVVTPKKETDQYGNTHGVHIGQTKDQREAKADKVWIGNGKEYIFQDNQNTTNAPSQGSTQPAPSAENDLPF